MKDRMQDLHSQWATCGGLSPVPLSLSCSPGQLVILHSCRPRKVRAINHGRGDIGGARKCTADFGRTPQAALSRVRIVDRFSVAVWPLSRCGFWAPDSGTECDLRPQKVGLNHQTRKVTVRPLSRCGFVASDWGTKCGFWGTLFDVL